MFIRNAWYMATWAADVTEKPLARTLLGEPIVLYRTKDGAPAALADRCCHRGFPLAHGEVVAEGLQCGYHGLIYDRGGACIRIPGQDKIPPSARVRAYPVVERDRILWLWPGDPALADPASIVSYPYHDDVAHWPHKTQTMRLNCSYDLVIDNLLDLTHLAYVHRRTIGGNPDAHMRAEMHVDATPNGVHFIRWLLNSIPPPTYVAGAGFTGRVDRWMDFEFVAPGAVVQFTGALDVNTGARTPDDPYGGKREGGFALRILHCIVPETEHSCFYFWSAANGYRQHEPAATEQLFEQIDSTFREDELVLEAQYARVRAQKDPPLMNLNSDRARVLAHQALRRLANAETGETQSAAAE
jgi:vanillate O-demethylase monooxygenase subunit